MTICTWLAGTRNSSAAACVNSAREPCPPSTLPRITVMTPSVPMCNRAEMISRPARTADRRRVPGRARRGNDEQQTRAEKLHERTAVEAEIVTDGFEQFVVIDLFHFGVAR